MRSLRFLLTYSLRRVRTLVIAMGALLAAFQLILIVVARSIQGSNAFSNLEALMPPFARELLGPSLISMMSFQGIVCLGYFHLSVMGALTALSISLATIPSSEVECGFIDVILARPLARHWVITRTVLVVTIAAAVLLGLMVTATWAGLHMLAPRDVQWPSTRLIFSLACNLGLLILCWGGIALAIGSGARRRSAAGGLAGLLALATFLLDYVARLWHPAESVAWLSPFRYYSPFELLQGNPLPIRNLLILAAVAAAGCATAYLVFARRDITH